jgi:aspartate racemase
MKTIGLIGGMSWESSLEYYRLINEGVKARLGGLHSAKCIMLSVDFAEVEELQRAGRWDESGRMMAQAAASLQSGGADCIVLCTNTMHIVSDAIQQAVSIPFLHIADAAAEVVLAAGIRKVGLLGTRFTMEKEFYKDRLADKFGLEVVIPAEEDRDTVHHIIYEELVLGTIREESRREYVRIIGAMQQDGAEGVILGCTEIGLLVRPEDSPLPLFDTTCIHAEAAVGFAING